MTQTTEPLDHLILKGSFYYRPEKQGYTRDQDAAGRYTKADAEREASIEPRHMRAVPVSSLPAKTTDPRSWIVYRNRRGRPRWYQRYIEAWWIIRGKWSLHRAWQEGITHGSAMEYQRTVIKRGQMMSDKNTNLCDCELSHNGLGIMGRECDCPAGRPQPAPDDPSKVSVTHLSDARRAVKQLLKETGVFHVD